MLHGWIIVDKPAGITSSQVVYRLRKLFNQKKIGHGGTLDPFATGILPIALGEATKTQDYIFNNIKEYEFSIKFGCETDTLDCDGKVVNQTNNIPKKLEIDSILHNFIGEIQQIPPQYSAIKINGKAAYKIARSGQVADLKSRPVMVHNLELIDSIAQNHFKLRVKCGKGLYVRSLAKDIAHKLDSLCYVTDLNRTKLGKFSLKDTISLDKLEKIYNNSHSCDFINPLTAVLDDILALELNDEDYKSIKNGRYLDKDLSSAIKNLVVTYDDKLVAICENIEGLVKPKRVFNY